MHSSLSSALKNVAVILAAASVARAQDWDAALKKADAAIAQLSLDEKVGMVTGTGWMKGPCVGNVTPVNKIGYPALCAQDGPLGIRFAQPITANPAGINAAATWDADLIKARGAVMGEEAKALGVNVQLGPVSGPMGKNPLAGRNWEGFGPDPYLNGVAMTNTIQGMQGAGVQACAKHLILNEQENGRDRFSSNADDRTIREFYLWPFQDAIKAGVASIMCSYNKILGTYACESDFLLNKLVKQELGFQGYVMSDWNAQHTTEGSANSGLDMTMPGTDFSGGNVLWGPQLKSAVQSGKVKESRVNDMVRRNLAAWYMLGQDQGYPKVSFNSWNGGRGGPDLTAKHKQTARDVAAASVILLKNVNGTLPLNKPKSIAIIGADSIVNPSGPNACPDRNCNQGTLAQGWGSGSVEFPYLSGPLDAIKARASKDGTIIETSTSDSADQGAAAARKADLAMVFINADSGEQYIDAEGQTSQGDRLNFNPWHNGNDLVKAVAQAGKPTVVVVHSVGQLDLTTILSQPNIVGLVWAGIPGQESGNSLADVLYGDVNPSGRLPYTIAKKTSDYQTGVLNGDDQYSEGVFVDYRSFDKRKIDPLYEFGFGLSYTTFDYQNVKASVTASAGPLSKDITSGGPKDAYDVVGTITVDVSNNGTVAGAEIPQLYLSYPSGGVEFPPKQLRGFNKVLIGSGETKTVEFSLRKKDISYYDASSKQWTVPSGEFGVNVGASSRDIRLTSSFKI